MPGIAISDEDLKMWFERIAQGDEDAFTKVFMAYHDYILPFATKRLKSEEDALDLVQEVFLRLWLYRSTLDQVINPKAYLYRMIYTTLLKRYEKLQKQIDFVRDFATEYQLPSVFQPDVVYNDLQARLAVAIEQLPSERRKIFRLRQSGLMPVEIAQELGVSVNTVKTQLKRAFATIRGLLAESGLPAILALSILDRL